MQQQALLGRIGGCERVQPVQCASASGRRHEDAREQGSDSMSRTTFSSLTSALVPIAHPFCEALLWWEQVLHTYTFVNPLAFRLYYSYGSQCTFMYHISYSYAIISKLNHFFYVQDQSTVRAYANFTYSYTSSIYEYIYMFNFIELPDERIC